jgi:hypothetical protein
VCVCRVTPCIVRLGIGINAGLTYVNETSQFIRNVSLSIAHNAKKADLVKAIERDVAFKQVCMCA